MHERARLTSSVRRASLIPADSERQGMSDLVHDGDPHLVDDLGVGGADRADRPLVDGDAVRKDAAVALVAFGERHALVEAQQTRRPVVLDQYGDVPHLPAEFGRQAIQCLADQFLDALRRDLVHGAIVRRARRWATLVA
jgi:hypothetical protein